MTTTNDAVLEAFKPFETFSKVMLDAFVIVNAEGKILKANPAASAVFGVTTKQLLKVDSLNSVLNMSVGDKPFSVTELLGNLAPTRVDDIEAKTDKNPELYITLGYFPFLQDGVVIGAFILIRDVTAETKLQDKYKDKASKSITDALTGLFNRAHFEEYMKTEEPRIVTLPAESDHRNLSIIMGDIDFFKKINDKYGHPAGDYIIKTVAQLFQKSFRKTDIVCRYGGEEFLVILPASDGAGSMVAAEKARATIEAYKFEFEGQVIPVTISIGIAQMKVGAELGKDTIARADQALYQSKQGGRNRVTLHDGSPVSHKHSAA